MHSVESVHLAGRGHSFEGRMWLQLGSVLVKVKITGRKIKQRALCKFQPLCLTSSNTWYMILKNLQKSSCQHFSLLFLVHLAFTLVGSLIQKKTWNVTFGQDVSGVEIKVWCLTSLWTFVIALLDALIFSIFISASLLVIWTCRFKHLWKIWLVWVNSEKQL